MTPNTNVIAPAPRAPSSKTPALATARIAILGASGYSGQEFVRLAHAHPNITIATLVSREHAGRPAHEMITGLDPSDTTLPTVVEPAALTALIAGGAFDTLVCCLPHGAWKTIAAEQPALTDKCTRILDLSSDFRDGAMGYAYGLPEAFRASLVDETHIANPGCYPTAAALALLPAVEAGALAGPVMVSALSGVSGAGRSTNLRTSYVELEGGAAIYKAGSVHQHVPEMERVLGRVAGSAVSVGFVPQLAPMARGILLTATVTLVRATAPEDVQALYEHRYAAEPFVRVLPAGQWPETRAVRGSNRCDLAVTTIHSGRTLLATAAIDNLVKGAAGQAIQNLNLMMGWPEALGLPVHGNPWA